MRESLRFILSMAAVLCAGALQPALAADVLVLPVRGTVLERPTLHDTVGAVLLDNLMSTEGGDLEFIDLTEAEPIMEAAADDYFSTCPHDAEAELGCGQILGEASDVRWVLLPRIRSPWGPGGPPEDAPKDAPIAVMEMRLLDIKKAQAVATWEVPISSAEDDWLAQSVFLSIEHALNPPADPEEDARILAELQEQERQRFLEAEKEAARRDLDTEVGKEGFSADEEARRSSRSRRFTDEDIADLERRGKSPWEPLGLTTNQYKSYVNSRLNIDEWRVANDNHFLQLLLGVEAGVGGGPASLRYYGAFIRNHELSGLVEEYAWQSVGDTANVSVGVFLGFGVAPFLEIEFAAGILPTRLWIKAVSAKLNDTNERVDPVDIQTRLKEPFQKIPITIPYIEPRVRYYFLRVPRAKPTLGVGAHMRFYPLPQSRVDFLCPAENLDSWEDCRDPQWPHLREPWNSFALYLEPGGMFEISRNLGIFVRLPLRFSLRRLEWSQGRSAGEVFEGTDGLRFLVGEAAPDSPPNRSPVSVGLTIGVQGRLFGSGGKRRTRGGGSGFDLD